jgi:thymidine phosphorylase
LLPRALATLGVAGGHGTVAAIDAERLGVAAVWLGAGRRAKDDAVDHAAGIVIDAPLDAHVEDGQPLCTLHHSPDLPRERVERATALAREAFVLAHDSDDECPDPAITMKIHAATRASRVIEVLR